MNQEELWRTFAQSGKVEDYLRYRGVTLPQTTNQVKEESGYGDRAQTTPNDRRPDSSGV